jgi:hypothetical protein
VIGNLAISAKQFRGFLFRMNRLDNTIKQIFLALFRALDSIAVGIFVVLETT